MPMSFDATYYLNQNADVLKAINAGAFSTVGDVNGDGVVNYIDKALFHFNQFGWKEGRNPNSTFDVTYYLAQNQDVKFSAVNPFTHFMNFGADEGRAPNANIPSSKNFDSTTYLAQNSDLSIAGYTTSNAYKHYVIFGEFEGRVAKTTAGDTINVTGGNVVNIGYSSGGVTFQGTYKVPVTFDLQAKVITTAGTNTYIDTQNLKTSSYDFTSVAGKGPITIKGTANSDIITAPGVGGIIEAMGGNDTILTSKTSTTTIVLGGVPAINTKIASPYDNGLDQIGMFDSNSVLTGAFKIGKGGDILDLHNFLGAIVTDKVNKPVDLQTAIKDGAPALAAVNGDVLILQEQGGAGNAPLPLTTTILNQAFSLPKPTASAADNSLNLIVLVGDTNASQNTYVYAVQHYASSVGSKAVPTFGGSDTITLVTTLVGINNEFVKGHLFDSSNFL